MKNEDGTKPLPLLVSVKRASELLGVSQRTVQYILARNPRELRARKIGRRTLIPYHALEAFARRDHATHGTADD